MPKWPIYTKRKNKGLPDIIYGQLCQIGFNGDESARHVLCRRNTPNGVKQAKNGSYVINIGKYKLLYREDDSTDIFQIGRNPLNNDIVLSDDRVSRFACRIIVSRDAPHTFTILAGGFNESKTLTVSESGFTTNRVHVLSDEKWDEISVNDEYLLHDGCIIDLCGVAFVFRNAFACVPSRSFLDSHDFQFPVGLTQAFYVDDTTLDHIFTACTHLTTEATAKLTCFGT